MPISLKGSQTLSTFEILVETKTNHHLKERSEYVVEQVVEILQHILGFIDIAENIPFCVNH